MKVGTTFILISFFIPACADLPNSNEVVAQSSVVAASLTTTPDLEVESIGDDGSGMITDAVVHSRVLVGVSEDSVPSQKPEFLSESSIPASLWRNVVDRASELEPDVRVPVTIELADNVKFDFSRFSDEGEAEVAQLVEERRAALKPIQKRFIRWLDEIGATNVKTHWLSNSVNALVPAGFIGALAARSDVRRVDDPVRGIPLSAAWSGLESRNGTFVSHLTSAGKTGECCGRLGAQVLVGIFDQGSTMNYHPAWNDYYGGSRNRLRLQLRCTWEDKCSNMYVGTWPG